MAGIEKVEKGSVPDRMHSQRINSKHKIYFTKKKICNQRGIYRNQPFLLIIWPVLRSSVFTSLHGRPNQQAVKNPFLQ